MTCRRSAYLLARPFASAAALLLLGCSHPDASAPRPAALGRETASTAPVIARLVSQRQGGLTPSAAVRVGERLALQLSLTEPQLLYLYWIDARGQAQLAYSSPVGQPEPSGSSKLPPSGAFVVADPVGDAQMLILASPRPLTEAARLAYLPLTQGAQASRGQPLTLATRGGRIDAEGALHLSPDAGGVCAMALPLRVVR